MKNVSEIFAWICAQQFVFQQTIVVHLPCVYHLREVAVVESDPSIENSGENFEEKENDQLRITQSRMPEKSDPCHKPGKEEQVSHKQQIFQGEEFSVQNKLIK